jgi:hypothetical protein
MSRRAWRIDEGPAIEEIQNCIGRIFVSGFWAGMPHNARRRALQSKPIGGIPKTLYPGKIRGFGLIESALGMSSLACAILSCYIESRIQEPAS